jgi:hypothetical protein
MCLKLRRKKVSKLVFYAGVEEEGEPLVIDCLTDELFPPGYKRTTFRRESQKYLNLEVGDFVVLKSHQARAEAIVLESTPDLTLDDILNWDLPADSPYPTGQAVINQIRRVYPDADKARYIALVLQVEDER